VADVYRGLQWWKQNTGVSKTSGKNSISGVFKPADSLQQFMLRHLVYLNMDPDAAMFPGPLARPWNEPKVLANAARISRGPWRMAAAYDPTGLVASQAFFGVWPTSELLPPEAIEAILNSPLTNAFLAEHASTQHITNELLNTLPMPRVNDLGEIVLAVRHYRAALVRFANSPLRDANEELRLDRLLVEVDAAVLKAYDLPPKLERRLLNFFRGHEGERRVAHAFNGWIPADFTAYIPLHEYLGPLLEQNRGAWALDVFIPAPEDEAEALERFVR
jgi:hypothetical protein